MKKLKKWFLRTFVYRVYQKSHMTTEGMLVIKTYLSGCNYVSYSYLGKDDMSKVLWTSEVEKKNMESYRFMNFNC
jgi:hypothetical protein